MVDPESGEGDRPSAGSPPTDGDVGPGQAEAEAEHRERPQGMVPGRERRRSMLERGLMRVIATGGIIAIAVALGAVLTSQEVAGWIIGLAVGLTSVLLAALLWSSRQL